MQNLGKVLFLFFVCMASLYGSIISSVNTTKVQEGEQVRVDFKLSGENIQRPNLSQLCGEDIIGSSSATSIQVLNNKSSKSYVLSYTFVARKSCEIQALSVEIDGEAHTSKAIQIEVSKRIVSRSDSFQLYLQTEKKEVYVGEAFELSLLFRQKKTAKVLDNQFEEPKFTGFWMKGEPKQSVEENGDFLDTKVTYTLTAQRVGVLNIHPAKIAIATRQRRQGYFGSVFPDITWKTYYSNELNVEAKTLPDGAKLIGDFEIEAVTSTHESYANEAVHVEVMVKGEGNLEDISSFKPYVENVGVFDEKIQRKKALLSQKISFIGGNDFIIPSFSLRYFNPKTQRIEEKETPPIKIHITNPKAEIQKPLLIQKESSLVQEQESILTAREAYAQLQWWNVLLIFVLGILTGMLFMYLKPWILILFTKKKAFPKEKELLVQLMAYKEEKEAQEWIVMLEKNIYQNANKTFDTKAIKLFLRERKKL